MAAHEIAIGRRAGGTALLALLGALAACHQGGGTRTAARTRPDSTAERTTGVATEREWQGRPVARVEELFAGRFAGVNVYQQQGGIAVRIRGTSTFNGSTEPLYLIDGFPYTPGPDGLLAINPGDVATIRVLKDAASLAEYGVRGANGVVVITTKRGR